MAQAELNKLAVRQPKVSTSHQIDATPLTACAFVGGAGEHCGAARPGCHWHRSAGAAQVGHGGPKNARQMKSETRMRRLLFGQRPPPWAGRRPRFFSQTTGPNPQRTYFDLSRYRTIFGKSTASLRFWLNRFQPWSADHRFAVASWMVSRGGVAERRAGKRENSF